MRKKILICFLIVIVAGISTTAVFMSLFTKKMYIREVESNLKSSVLLINHELSRRISAGESINYNDEAVKYSRILYPLEFISPESADDTAGNTFRTRITFINMEGRVVGDSETDYLSMENHKSRKEFMEATENKTGTDTRYSETLGIDCMYLAVRMDQADVVTRISIPLTRLKGIDNAILCYALLGILPGFVLVALFALKFTHSFTLPVKMLTSFSRDLAEGNYSRRLTLKTDDEYRQLADTFNLMAEKLSSTIEDLKNKNLRFDSIMKSMTNGFVAVDNNYRIISINETALKMLGINTDNRIFDENKMIGMNLIKIIRNKQISALLQETEEKNSPLVAEISIRIPEEKIIEVYSAPIKSSNSDNYNSGVVLSMIDITKIRKLERIRTEFVSNVTHELKTPLTSIRGFIETLKCGAIKDPKVALKFLDIIDIEAERLHMLINDILVLSEIEGRKQDVNISEHILDDIIEETLSVLQNSIKKRNITVNKYVDPQLKIKANRNRIKQMFINLIDNAVKYNKDGGSITITAVSSGGRIIITVEDSGIGIPEEHLERIFERFYRVDKSRSRSMGGTGLGLSIVKHIVNLYGGTIKIDSEPDKGTVFTVQLPE